MGTKDRQFAPLPDLSLEELVPDDHPYRRLEARINLSFVRDLVAPLYAGGGRPSVGPVVFFKLQLVMFFEGLRSERELMRVVADRLSLRWYLGYDLFEPLPDHSSLTRIRERFGAQIFRAFFERTVKLCVEAGLVRGRELYFDATKVAANAAVDSLATRFAVESHLSDLSFVIRPSTRTATARSETSSSKRRRPNTRWWPYIRRRSPAYARPGASSPWSARAMTLAQRREIDAVLVTELTRWGRSTQDLMSTLGELASWDVSLIAQTGLTFDLSTPQGRLVASLMASLAEFEHDLLRERVKSGIAAAKARGQTFGRAKGYRPSDERAPEVLRLADEENLSQRAIAARLGISKTTVNAILGRRAEAGRRGTA